MLVIVVPHLESGSYSILVFYGTSVDQEEQVPPISGDLMNAVIESHCDYHGWLFASGLHHLIKSAIEPIYSILSVFPYGVEYSRHGYPRDRLFSIKLIRPSQNLFM